MIDPIGSYERIKSRFLLYLRTAFGVKFSSIEEERKKLFSINGNLGQEIYIEPITKYKSSNKILKDLTKKDIGLEKDSLKKFIELSNCGLMGNFPLYSHQYDMLKSSLEGKNCIVTAGTGSGKTEAFLLPLFAQLAKEASKWENPKSNGDGIKWWENEEWVKECKKNKKSPRINPRVDEKRPAAVRALLIYPMNALVEDQLSRLRKALDSDKSLKWFKENLGNNKIYLGRYNGSTPVAGYEKNNKGKLNDKKIELLMKELGEKDMAFNSIYEKDPKNSNLFQKIGGSEMSNRWDMQECPPDILITNFSMLNVMMMRESDEGIFKKTRDWLEGKDIKDLKIRAEEIGSRKFHLIIDELHLYRGTSGTEVAYSLRLLLSRLGLHPNHPQLKILASSASLENEEENRKFLCDFFGSKEDSFDIINGVPEESEKNTKELEFNDETIEVFKLISENVEDIRHDRNLDNLFGKISDILSIKPTMSDFLNKLGSSNFAEIINSAFYGRKEKPGAIALTEFKKRIFRDKLKGLELDKATRGLLICLGLFENNDPDNLPIQFRVHFFFKNIEGLWSSILPIESSDNRPIGELYNSSKILTADNNRILETLYCEHCGTVFLGGNKLKLKENGAIELLVTEPDIEGIPEKKTTNYIEGRTYDKYAIFWPEGEQHSSISSWNQKSQGGEKKSTKANWVEATLNGKTGKINLTHEDSDSVKGYLFSLRDLDTEEECDFSAVPAVCPSCEADYSKRLRPSPVRGFRTGFTKLSELFIKELFSELPSEDRKLVSFSDTRQDAAKISSAVEREHNQDLFREVVYTLIVNEVERVPKLIKKIEESGDFSNKDQDSNEIKDLKKLMRKANHTTNDPDDDFLEQINEAKDKLNDLKEREINKTININELLSKRDEAGPLIKELLNIGVNPSGNTIKYQNFNLRGVEKKWHSLFDLDNLNWKKNLSEEEDIQKKKIIDSVIKRIGETLFGRLYFSFESSGLGWVKNGINQNKIAELSKIFDLDQEILNNVLDSYIRILGNNFRYRMIDPKWEPKDYQNYKGSLKKLKVYLEEVSSKYSIPNLGDELFKLLDSSDHNFGMLNIELLDIKVSKGDDPVWECQKCGYIHLHNSGGKCISCLSDLDINPNKKCEDVWKNNYLSQSVHKDHEKFRLHCEELSGQTDNQLERQLKFKGIFLDGQDNSKRFDEIDVLSVTTTMEVGVDIGNLRAVVLANMPPERFNYQQRVGRAGRRSQAFTCALTLCRGRSHDEFHFRNPEKITNDPCPDPFLTMGQERIIKRFVSKEVLRKCMRDIGIIGSDSLNSPDTHGEFGSVEDWVSKNREKAVIWFEENGDEISRTIIDLVGCKDSNLSDWVSKCLIDEIDGIIKNPEIIEKSLANLLAEGGILPLYGMPSRVRSLYHKITHQNIGSIERDLEIAIGEFSPGSQSLKDKVVHTAIGFSPELSRGWDGWRESSKNPIEGICWFAKCRACGFNRTFENSPGDEYKCENCGIGVGDGALSYYPIVTPKAFITDLNQEGKEEGFKLSSGKPLSQADSKSVYNEVDLGNLNCLASFSDYGKVWKINDNLGKLFEGGKESLEVPDIPGKYLNNIWKAREFSEHDVHDEKLALAAGKNTEVLTLSPKNIPQGITLNPYGELKSNHSSTRAALFSAAFLIQKAVSDRFDISVDEIEIGDFKTRKVGSQEMPVIVLTDRLPNGSGFVFKTKEMLEEILNDICNPGEKNIISRSILEDEHKNNCYDSCDLCLRNFRNMNFHGLLDWRLGMSFLRLMLDKEHKLGLDGNFNEFPELEDWKTNAKKWSISFSSEFKFNYKEYSGIPAIENELGDVFLIIHPLWDTKNPSGKLAEAIVEAGGENKIKGYIDTFNLLRRPGKCYEWITDNREDE